MGAAAAIARRLIQRINMKPAVARLKAPIASLTFDDFPKTAWTGASSLLRERGYKATYYVAGSLAGKTLDGVRYFDPEDLEAVAADGHELGCHGWSHARVPQLGALELARDFDRNSAFIREWVPHARLATFAFPYGEASPHAKRQAIGRFSTARGITRGVNRGVLDLSQLKAVGLERSRYRPQRIERFLDSCVRDPGWLIFFTHDVCDACSPYGATPEMFADLLDGLAARGIEVLPVSAALSRVLEPEERLLPCSEPSVS